MTPLDPAALRKLWPHAPQALVDAVVAHWAATSAKYGLTTSLRQAHFLAQVSHESGGGTITTENLNYTTAARIAAVWPRRFTAATAAAYVHNPQKLADAVYNGRMGNAPGTEDGFNFRGRGLLQITGRDSYRAIGAIVGLSLEETPDLVAAPSVALDVAAAEFQKLGCLPYCDADNVEAVTRRVNGGYTGLADRKAWLGKWKIALDNQAPESEPAAEPAALVSIPRGSDEVLPAAVDHPGQTLSQDRTAWAAIVGIITTMGATLGQAVDALKPLFADPRTLAVAAFVGLGVGAFILFERHAKLRSDHV